MKNARAQKEKKTNLEQNRNIPYFLILALAVQRIKVP